MSRSEEHSPALPPPRARERFLMSQSRRDAEAARADRAAWAVQRLLAAAATLSSTGSAFFFNDPATTEIYTLSLHDALPICWFSLSLGAWVPKNLARRKMAYALSISITH